MTAESVAAQYDVIIVGGGPGGLSSALWLARYRRRVCLFDTGEPRNRPAWAVHGYPGLSDPPPLELRARIRQQAIDAGAETRIGAVTSITGDKDQFTVTVHDGSTATARRIVLAYGLRDFLPDVPGIADFYGHSVYHCPDCDGPSVHDGRVGVIGNDRHTAALALYLLTWSSAVTILTNGATLDVSRQTAETLKKHDVAIETDAIVRLNGSSGALEEAVIGTRGSTSGDEDRAVPLDAIFFHLGSEPRCAFAADFGCEMDEDGYIVVDAGQQTNVGGVYAVGDIAGKPHLAVTAAAEGVRAALAIHRSLTPDEMFVGS